MAKTQPLFWIDCVHTWLVILAVAGDCTWPSALAGSTWEDSVDGDLIFTTDTMSGMSFTASSLTVSQWKCYSTAWLESDGYLVIRTKDQFQLLNYIMYGYRCLKISAITPVSYRYYIYNRQEQNANFARLSVNPDGTLTDLDFLCPSDTDTDTVRPTASEYRVMVKSGAATSAKVNCPYVFLGTYTYGVSCSAPDDTWSTCSTTDEMAFTSGTCSETVSYSVSDTVWCIDVVPVGTSHSVTIYNGNDPAASIDNSNVFRFSCYMIAADGTKASVTPNSCKAGQVPDAIPTDVATGSLSGKVIQLTRQETCPTCAPVSSLDNGVHVYRTDGAATTVTYQCNSGFSIAGPASRTCQGNLTWSEVKPTCTCILPAAPDNGQVSVSVDGTTITYTCNAGYVLIGDPTRTCQSDSNTWTGASASCDPCATLTATSGLNIEQIVEGTSTRALFTCHVGYTLDGSTSSTCTTAGQWDTPTPICALCPNITDPSSGSVTIETDGFTSVASFTCSTDYTLIGASNATCGTSGTWRASKPSCECTSPSPPTGGDVTVTGTQATYTCNVGYSISGTQSRTCQTDGSGWSGSAPTCVVCQTLTAPDNGYFNTTTNGHETDVTYSCLVGYSVVGSKTAFCAPDGEWIPSASPTCVKCEDLSDPSSGTVTIGTNEQTSSATYACANGYIISGSTIRFCTENGEWTGSQPVCLCSNLASPSNGDASQDGITANFTCDVGYTMNGESARVCSQTGAGWSGQSPSCVFCTTLQQMSGGTLNLLSDGITTRALFTCDVGYTLKGTSNTTCQSDGTWDSGQSTCTPCETMALTEGVTSTLFTENNVTTVANFSCPSGYTLNGDESLTCDPDGNWDAAVPACAKCSDVQSPSSGSVNVVTNGITTTASYACVTGYYLIGQPTITCLVNGSWSQPESTCTCNSPPVPTNGSISVSGDTVTFSCDVGFTMSGTFSGTCGSDGSGWDIQTPDCVSCDVTSDIPGGSTTFSTDGVNTNATYSCSVGTSLKGSSSITCNSTGQWVQDQPECVACTTVPPVDSGSISVSTDGVTTTTTVSCTSGYHITGSSTMTCTTSGTWDVEPPTCVCDSLPTPDGGSIAISDDGLTATFSCNLGYTMSGQQNITCATDGSGWVVTEPSCNKCQDVSAPVGGGTVVQTSGVQTSLQFTCEVGSTLEGVADHQCQEDGTWNITTQPTCVTCSERQAPQSGYVNVTTDGQTTVAVYSCVEGYALTGQPQATCLSNGTWDYPVPSCMCNTPIAPANGSVTIEGEALVFSCDVGFSVSGHVTGTCKADGTGWDIQTPDCVSCDGTNDPSGGVITYVTDGATTRAVYSCSMGATLQGTHSITCNSTGHWISDPPTCVSCPTLTDVASGSLTTETNGTTTTAKFSCDPGYFVNGSDILTCTSSGTWDAQQPTCLCNPLSSPTGGSFTMSEDGYTVTFTCDVGYTMSGVQNITCGQDGSGWNVTESPTCAKCPDIPAPAAGSATLLTSGTMTTVQYTCGLGYSIDGVVKAECQPDGTWSITSQPSCVSCPTLTDVASGSLTTETNGTTTTAKFSCDPGYFVNGSDILTCTSSATWDAQQPKCLCNPLSSPTGGSFNMSEDGYTVTFTCDVGYTMSGVQNITCGQDGSGWSVTEPPTCAKCPDIPAPGAGSATLLTSGTMTTVQYTCGLGHSIDGVVKAECQPDGTWSITSQPSCVSCPSLSDVASGSKTTETNGTTTTAKFSCDPGYFVNGSDSLICTSSGTWDVQQPKCLCNPLSSPTGGSFNMSEDGYTVTFTCDVGYTMSGVQNITCGQDGSGWSVTESPTCAKCPDIPAPAAGSATLLTSGTMTTVQYTCGLGYSIDGVVKAECQPDGTWSIASQPSCAKCPNEANIQNGEVTVSTNGQTTIASYTCMTGYELIGNQTLTCQTTNSWDMAPPACYCTVPEAPPNGTVSVSDDRGTLTYTCTVGYTLVGTTTRTCQTSGLGWTGSSPSCNACSAWTSPSDGSFKLTTDGSVTMATLQCDLGYTMDGSAQLTCLDDGSWDTSPPTCVQCASLPPLSNGSINVTTSSVQTRATFSCVVGTSLSGEHTSFCQTDSSWDPSSQSCVQCEARAAPDSGDVKYTTDGTVTTATITCVSGYHVDGAATLQCRGEDGTWTGAFPACYCDTPGSPGGGSVTVVVNTAQYTCDLGRSLAGDRSRTCGGTGSGWQGQQPTCSICSPLASPDQGTIAFHTNGTTTTATFTCSQGTSLNGTAQLTCKPDGSMDLAPPICVTCEDLPVPANGGYDYSTDGRTTSVTLQCHNGYVAKGFSDIKCQADGSWTSTAQSCEPSTTEESESLLPALIGVTVASLLLIITLGIVLARYMYLYYRNVGYKKGTSGATAYDVSYSNGKIAHLEDDTTEYSIPLVKVPRALAPTSHQHHMLEMGRLTTSPPPEGHDKHVTDGGPTPRSRPPTGIPSPFGVDAMSTTLSLSSVDILPPVRTPRNMSSTPENKLKKSPKPKAIIKKAHHNPTSGRSSPFLPRSITPVRAVTPVNHPLTSQQSNTQQSNQNGGITSVSNVDT